MARFRPLGWLEWGGVLIGNGILVGFLVAGSLTLVDLLLLSTLEMAVVLTICRVRDRLSGRDPQGLKRLLGSVAVFAFAWAPWLVFLGMSGTGLDLLLVRVGSPPTGPEHLLHQPQIVAPLLVTVASGLWDPDGPGAAGMGPSFFALFFGGYLFIAVFLLAGQFFDLATLAALVLPSLTGIYLLIKVLLELFVRVEAVAEGEKAAT